MRLSFLKIWAFLGIQIYTLADFILNNKFFSSCWLQDIFDSLSLIGNKILEGEYTLNERIPLSC